MDFGDDFGAFPAEDACQSDDILADGDSLNKPQTLRPAKKKVFFKISNVKESDVKRDYANSFR
jgi:hypothetical protein